MRGLSAECPVGIDYRHGERNAHGLGLLFGIKGGEIGVDHGLPLPDQRVEMLLALNGRAPRHPSCR